MKVGLDISQIAHPGGVGVYTQNLAENLQKIEDIEVSYFYSSLRKPYKGKLSKVRSYRLPPTLFEVLFNKIRTVPIEKFLGPIDIFHSSDWVQPPTKAKKVTTYHDVIPLKYPDWSDPKIVAVHKRRLSIVEREIDLVIAVSETTKADLRALTKIPEEKIVVIYEGVNERFRPQPKESTEQFRKKYNLPEKFVLAIGGIGQRRNIKSIKSVCKKYDLVISGVTLPYLDESEMPQLYSSASVLLYPSFYEGFGLPILEAQACGIPVITSNLGSMKEISEGSSLLVDPNNLDQMAEKLKKIMTDENLRDDLVNKGLKNAKKFSWQKCAEQTAQVYRQLV